MSFAGHVSDRIPRKKGRRMRNEDRNLQHSIQTPGTTRNTLIIRISCVVVAALLLQLLYLFPAG